MSTSTATEVCPECDGTGLVTKKTFINGIEFDYDDQPCPECDIETREREERLYRMSVGGMER